MNIGNIIKYHRRKKNLTQAELCHGICSITHLSKIESNSKEVDSKTISLLLSRLELSLSEVSKMHHELVSELDTFFNRIIYYEQASAKELYNLIKAKEELFTLTDHVYTYHLYLYRYYLLTGEYQASEAKRRFLEPFLSVFSQYEKHLFSYFNGILLIQKGKYVDALDIFLAMERERSFPSCIEGEFYYQIGLTYSYLRDDSRSITYTQKAISEFSKHFNYIRIIHAQTLLGIEYTELGLLQDARVQFEHLIRNVKLMNQSQLLTMVYHNLAILYEREADDEQAAHFYLLAQQYATNQQQYYMSLCNITEILIKQGKNEQALENINHILKNTKSDEMMKFHLIFKYHQYFLTNKTKRAMNHLENNVIPYLERKNLIKDLHKYAIILGDYYTKTDSNKALFFYKKSNNLQTAYTLRTS
jgi:HTH-type transcriptional regulator, quorum sensing regulator NprR